MWPMNEGSEQRAEGPCSLEDLASTSQIKSEQMNFTHQVLLSNERAGGASFG